MKVRHDGYDHPCQLIEVKDGRVKVLILIDGHKTMIDTTAEYLVISDADRYRLLGGTTGRREPADFKLVDLLRAVKNWPPAPPPIDLRALLDESCPFHQRGAR